jgi:hypothetical protein
LLRALTLVILTVAFTVGFWTRGVITPAGRATESDSENGVAAAVAVVNRPVDGKAHDPAALRDEGPMAARVVGNGPPSPEEISASENPPMPRIVMPPETASRRSHTATAVRAEDDLQSQGVRPLSNNAPDAGDGFSLKNPRLVRQVSAEVIRPDRVWFETAATDEACASGTCPVPVARLDRKLNTALEWSASPAIAADQAQREGKLVFLIHVSGNFAQPGFT